MNREHARQLLATWKPTREPHDAEFAEALELAAADPDLQTWFQAHQSFQQATQQVLRDLPVPADLCERILASRKVVPPPFYTRSRGWVAAAAVAASIVVAIIWWSGITGSGQQGDFSIFRSRMVRATLREYRMDIETNNLAAIRQFLTARQAPADFELTPSLSNLQLVGGGVLSWHGHPVSMVCLDGHQLGMLYLFIVPTEAIAGGAPAEPTVEEVKTLATASWTRNSQTYLLASSASPEALQKLLIQPSPG
jgi:hypothetical protein